MASVITLGLSKIEVAPLLQDGSPGTDFKTLGYTVEDSCNVAEDDPSEVAVNVEESNYPIKRKKKKGNLVLSFNIADPDVETLKETRGGTISTAGGKRTYREGDTFVGIERTIRVTPEEGYEAFIINRAEIYGKLNAPFGRNNPFIIEVSASVMQPLKAGVSVIEFVQADNSASPETFDTSLAFSTVTQQQNSQVTVSVLATDANLRFEFNKIASPSGTPNSMSLKSGATELATVDFPSDYLGQYFRFTTVGGTTHTGQFANGDVQIN